jgi:DeoR family transcriptional regulator, aga operon transcriptional repressor
MYGTSAHWGLSLLDRDQAVPYATSNARRTRVLRVVEEQGYCTIAELSRAFGVSEMTIRRDIQRLEGDGNLRSVHGGVTTLAPAAMVGTDFRARAGRMREAKAAIAVRGLEFLPESGAVAIDAGTSTLELAKMIPRDRPLQIVTHSLAAINALLWHGDVEVTCLGGRLNPQSQSFGGLSTSAAIEELHVRTFFLAATGITPNGVYCGTDFEAVTKRSLVRAADQVVLLADSSKFRISAMVRACSLEDVQVIITDDGIAAEHLAYLEQLPCQIVLVSLDR